MKGKDGHYPVVQHANIVRSELTVHFSTKHTKTGQLTNPLAADVRYAYLVTSALSTL